MAAIVTYLSDVEGQWTKLDRFCRDNPFVALGPDGLRIADGATFVFGGDSVDRGPAGRRVVRTLLDAKRAQPDRVVVLAGNRDINKLRLARELRGAPPRRAPDVRGAALLRWILAETMGARRAFEHRRTELRAAGEASDDDAVTESFLADVAPDGELCQLLARSALAHRVDETLFVHGGVTAESFLCVPGRSARCSDVDAWVAELNEFIAAQVAAFVADRHDPRTEPAWAELIGYQAPRHGTSKNQGSVVYARPTDEVGNPLLPSAPVVRALRAAGVRRVVVGHTPSGDCPAVVRDGRGFELVLADNSYGRVEPGSQVYIEGSMLRIVGETELDGGERAAVRFEAHLDDSASPLGLRMDGSEQLVKARLERGDWLLFRGLAGRGVEQLAASDAALRRQRLVPPPAYDDDFGEPRR